MSPLQGSIRVLIFTQAYVLATRSHFDLGCEMVGPSGLHQANSQVSLLYSYGIAPSASLIKENILGNLRIKQLAFRIINRAVDKNIYTQTN